MPAPGAIKVLHLVNGEFYAGAERVQDLLAIQLLPLGFAVSFACLKEGVFAARRRAQEAPVYSWPMRSRLDLALCRRLARFVQTEKFRVLHTHTPRSALVGRLVALLARVPMVHHVHSPAERDTEHHWRNLANGMVEKYSLRGARRLIAVSASLEQNLKERGFAAKSIRRIPNGVPVGEPRRRPYHPGQELTIGMIALFRPRKGIEVLLEAMARVHRAGHRVRLHAVGPFEAPDYERSVLDLVRQLGLEQSVTWTGFRADVGAEFQQMQVFVLPSLYGEGMPMVVLEAMAAGLPVVSTRVEGIPEVIRHGEDGLLVQPSDPNELAEGLMRFVRGEVDATAMGDAGWHRQRESFSDVSMAAGVAAVYQEVLGS